MEGFGIGTEKTGLRVALPEEVSQRLVKRTGVILNRGNYMEGDLSIQLFLKDSGTTWVYLPGASRGSQRFGGAVEPLVWGRYQLYQSRRRTFLKEVEVTEDFWELRRAPKAVLQAVQWVGYFNKYLIAGYPYNDLLALFFWALKALAQKIPESVVNARFLWRWLLSWGIAPDLIRCTSCGRPLNGRAVPHEGAFVCSDCGDGMRPLEIDEFALYALGRSFIPDLEQRTAENILRLRKQAEPLQNLFIQNLEGNR